MDRKMNANELAEIIQHLENANYIGASKAATMLREQQAEIEALKQIIDANNLSQNIGQFVKPANEPVAWMSNGKEFYVQKNYCPDFIPLYTHPYKPSKSEVDALLDNADYVVGIMRKEIEEWKRKYKDMHNLATQAMSKVHQLEKEAQEK